MVSHWKFQHYEREETAHLARYGRACFRGIQFDQLSFHCWINVRNLEVTATKTASDWMPTQDMLTNKLSWHSLVANSMYFQHQHSAIKQKWGSLVDVVLHQHDWSNFKGNSLDHKHDSFTRETVSSATAYIALISHSTCLVAELAIC